MAAEDGRADGQGAGSPSASAIRNAGCSRNAASPGAVSGRRGMKHRPLLGTSGLIRRGAFVPDDARSGGLFIVGPSGWGKSRLLGRSICHQDALRRIGTVVLDVVGGTIDNALDKVFYLPKKEQLELGARIRYCNVAGERAEDGRQYVPAFPMLAPRRPEESLYETSQRLIDLIAKTDRALASAS